MLKWKTRQYEWALGNANILMFGVESKVFGCSNENPVRSLVRFAD